MTVLSLDQFKALKASNIKHMATLVALESENEKLREKIVKLQNEIEFLTVTLDGYRNGKEKRSEKE